jgi:hypothetical protein
VVWAIAGAAVRPSIITAVVPIAIHLRIRITSSCALLSRHYERYSCSEPLNGV